MRVGALKTIMVLTLGLTLLSGCGAPTKSAGDVSYLFNDASVGSLQDKLYDICNTLDQRTEHPKLDDMPVKMDGCRNAGLAAVNYRKASKFHFLGVDDGKDESDDIASYDVRGQVWLNKTLLGMAQAVGGLMKAKEEGGGTEDGALSLPDSGGGGGFEGLATPKLEQQNVFVDQEALAFGMDLRFQLTGVVDVDLVLEIRGQLINNNAFAVTIRTTNDPEYEKSFIKGVNAVAVVIPHASDMYMDTWLKLEIYKIGLADAVIEEQISNFLGSGLKQMIDSAMQL